MCARVITLRDRDDQDNAQECSAGVHERRRRLLVGPLANIRQPPDLGAAVLLAVLHQCTRPLRKSELWNHDRVPMLRNMNARGVAVFASGCSRGVAGPSAVRPRSRRARSISAGVLGLALAVITTATIEGSARADCTASDPREGSRANRFDLPSTAGRNVRFPAAEPRVTVLAFWAHWCKPCFEEIPAYERLVGRFKGQVELVLVAIDDDPDDVKTALNKMKLRRSSAYRGETALKSYRHSGVPFTLVIDKKGVIKDVHRGFEKRCLPKLRQAIQALL